MSGNQNNSNTNSGSTSKRSSPPVPAPPAKRQKNDSATTPGNSTTPTSTSVNTNTNANASTSANTANAQTTQGGGSGGSAGPGMVISDPDQLSDVLTAAGIDIKKEEQRMQDEMQREYDKIKSQKAPKMSSDFLDINKLRAMTKGVGQENGVAVQIDKENDLAQLLQLATHEWMIGIVTDMVALNRHRKRSRNDAHSEIGRALRSIAIKDKEAEDRRIAHKTMLGLETGENEKKAGSEETQYRNANATALMMTGKKKYSWMAGGGGAGGSAAGAAGAGGLGATSSAGGLSAGGSRGGGGGNTRNDMNIRYREAREEPQLAMRDLLGALEDRRYGVERTKMKGYARMKN